jgi:hypothetical protein
MTPGELVEHHWQAADSFAEWEQSFWYATAGAIAGAIWLWSCGMIERACYACVLSWLCMLGRRLCAARARHHEEVARAQSDVIHASRLRARP